jgi:hypothetical protein
VKVKAAEGLQDLEVEKPSQGDPTGALPEAEPPPDQGPKERGDQDDDRDLKAVKADDTAAPIWLWNDAIRNGLKSDPADRGHSEEMVDRALEVMRVFCLCRGSRLGVIRSYFGFIHKEYPDLHKPEQIEVRSEPYLRKGKGKDDPLIPGIRYTWRPRFGKASYKAWWNSYWSSNQALPEKEAGRDVIWRVAKASWWEWEEGLVPFYWPWPHEYQATIRDRLEIWFSGEKPNWKRPQRVEKDEATRQKAITKIAQVWKQKYISPGYV